MFCIGQILIFLWKTFVETFLLKFVASAFQIREKKGENGGEMGKITRKKTFLSMSLTKELHSGIKLNSQCLIVCLILIIYHIFMKIT